MTGWRWRPIEAGTGNRVYLSLGSNMGDREGYLRNAVQLISKLPHTQAVRASSIYETEPVGYTDQGSFLNMVLCADTALKPEDFLDRIMEIERGLGRERLVRWGPRTIDIDILLYGQMKIDTPRLTVPHPRMEERAFVLVPLKEIAPEGFADIDPERLLKELENGAGVELYCRFGGWQQ